MSTDRDARAVARGEARRDVTAIAEVIREAQTAEFQTEEVALAILASDWLAARDRRVAAEALREAADAVQKVYDLQCPAGPRERYVDVGALWAHQWWEKVLGGELGGLRERANRIERGTP